MSKPLIAVIDYGMGNLRSVEKGLERAGARAQITGSPDQINAADGVVLPGVSAFPEAMRNLKRLGLDEIVAERLTAAVPVLGLCLGTQLIFEASSERGGGWGLGLLPGRVDRLPSDECKVPHIGWNSVTWSKPSELTAGLPDGTPFYFVHSYASRPANGEDVLGVAEHGAEFVCAVERPPLYGVQFHPEKSSAAGIKMLGNFAAICNRAKADLDAASR